jgi:hypothetical protein
MSNHAAVPGFIGSSQPFQLELRMLRYTFRELAKRLPDGIFSYQKSQFGYILEGPGIEIVGIVSVHFEYLRPFGIFYDHLVILCPFGIFYPCFGILYQDKSGNPELALSSQPHRVTAPFTLKQFQLKRLFKLGQSHLSFFCLRHNQLT